MQTPPRTPRDILLARHADAHPALAAQRDTLLARFGIDESTNSATGKLRVSPPSPLAFFTTLHRELIAPYRRAWGALACVWLAILTLQQIDRLAPPSLAPARVASSTSAADVALLALWLDQRRLVEALAANLTADPGARARPMPPAESLEKTSAPSAAHPLGGINLPPSPLAWA